MPANTNKKSWKDIQTVISAVAVSITIGIWNLVAAPSKSSIGGATGQANLGSQTNSYADVTPALPLLPGQILLFKGALPPGMTPTAQPSTISQPSGGGGSHRGGGGGGGGTVTRTSSSHP